jgi:uncharacterized protein YsxB (DUF464 family)
MIEVTYYREHNRVTVSGHAHSAEYGRDLVCAAVSALVLTLEANVRHLAAKDYVTAYTARLEPGDAEISCSPRNRYRKSVRQVCMSVCVGFEVLAEKYPDYISYAVRGW